MTFADQVAEIVKEDTTTDGFVINTMEEAVEADKRIAYNQEQQANIDQIAGSQVEALQAKIDRIKHWAEEAKKGYVTDEQFYAHRLEFFLRDQIDSGRLKNKKSIKLPNTTIQMKKQPEQFVKDEKLLLDYAREKGFVKKEFVENIDWAGIKSKGNVMGDKLVDENGEAVPGVTVNTVPDKFAIKVSK